MVFCCCVLLFVLLLEVVCDCDNFVESAECFTPWITKLISFTPTRSMCFSNATLRMFQWTRINKNPLAIRSKFKLEPLPKHNPLAHQWETG